MKQLIETIILKELENARDLGGIKTKDGKRIKKQKMFRGSSLSNTSFKNAEALYEKHNIRQIIDLRSKEEIEKSKDLNLEKFDYSICTIGDNLEKIDTSSLPHEFDLIENKSTRKTIARCLALSRRYLNNDSCNVFEAMKLRYLDFVTNPESLFNIKNAILKILSLKEGATLFHCASGKDRTGILTFLILLILGVDKDDAVREYLLSNQLLNERILDKKRNFKTEDLNLKKPTLFNSLLMFQGVDEAWINVVYEEIEKNGGIENFFINKLDITSEQIALLKNKFLSNDSSIRKNTNLFFFSLDKVSDEVSFSYAIFNNLGLLQEKNEILINSEENKTLIINNISKILNLQDVKLISLNLRREYKLIKETIFYELIGLIGSYKILDLKSILVSDGARVLNYETANECYQKYIGYSFMVNKNKAELLLEIYNQAMVNLTFNKLKDNLVNFKCDNYYISIKTLQNLDENDKKDKEEKTKFLNNIMNNEIKYFVFFDIECANCFNGAGKICEFSYVKTDTSFRIQGEKRIFINPGKGKEFRFDLVGRKRKQDIHLKGEKDNYKVYFQSKEFDHYADNIRFLFEKMPNTLFFGYSVSNDLRYLEYTFRRYQLKQLQNLFVFDVQTFYKILYKTTPSLEKAYEALAKNEEKETKEFHDSLFDSKATMIVLKKLLEEKQTSLQDLFQKFGNNALICNETYIYSYKNSLPKVKLSKNKSKNIDRSKMGFTEFFSSLLHDKDYLDKLKKEDWKNKRVGISSVLKNSSNWKEVYESIVNCGYIYAPATNEADIMLCENENDCLRINEEINGKLKYVIYKAGYPIEEMAEFAINSNN